jgi:glutamate-1-semialdehyde 2,1-aminomutase
MIDRQILRHLEAEEDERFVACTDVRGARQGGPRQPARRRADGMDDEWPGSFPIVFDSANGAHCTDVDGIEYIDFCLGDTGAMTGHGLVQCRRAARQALRGITTMLPSVDAAWVGGELARRFGLPAWQNGDDGN